MTQFVLGEYLEPKRRVTQAIKNHPELFDFNFEMNKEQHRARVTKQVSS